MAGYIREQIIPVILSTVLLCTGCEDIWIPPINNEYAVQESGERYPMTAVGVFRGEPVDEGYRISMGITGSGIAVYPYPPRGTGPTFLCSFSSENDRYLKPGRYTHSGDDDTFVSGTFSIAEIFTEYNMDDFEAVIGRPGYEIIGGSVNIYSYSSTRMHFSWSLEVLEYIDTGREPNRTGVKTIIDGNYKGEYAFYDVPVDTEHKGFCVKGKFHPLASAFLIEEPSTNDVRRLFIRLTGPDAGISNGSISGTDANIEIRLTIDRKIDSATGHYPLISGAAGPNLLSSVLVYQQYDFDEGESSDKASRYLPVSGYSDIRFLTDEYIDIIWSIEMEEYTGDYFDSGSEHSSSPGRSSYELNGAYSGEYLSGN